MRCEHNVCFRPLALNICMLSEISESKHGLPLLFVFFSGQAAYNPNFQEIKGDWRERIKQRQSKAKSGAAADQKDT